MKAMVLKQPGQPGSLVMQKMDKPEPGPAEIRVRVKSVSLNPVDYKLAAAGHPEWKYPFILGLDVAGTVDAVGETVRQWQVGDPVFYHGDLSRPGGYAEYAVTTAHTAARIPERLSFIEAAALPCAGLTAYQSVYRKINMANLRTILVHAGAGGVGGFAVQLARQAGLTIFTTCSESNHDWVKQLGAHEAIDYRQEDVGGRIRSLTQNLGVDAILNTVSPESALQDIGSLAFNGHLVCIAGFPDLSGVNTRDKAISLHTVALGRAHSSGNQAARQDLAVMASELAQMVAEGQIDPMISQVIRLEEIPEALEQLSRRHVRGKIVVDVQ